MLHPIQIKQPFDYILLDETQEMVSTLKQHAPDMPVTRQTAYYTAIEALQANLAISMM
jgi:hypothetical protein